MREFFLHLEFARPFFFWLLLGLPLLWLRFRQQNFAVMVLRSLVVALLVMILADPQTSSRQVQDNFQQRIFAFDLSRSIPPDMRRWMETAARQLEPTGRDRFFVFGSRPKEVSNWSEQLRDGPLEPDAIRPEKTDLESLFSQLLQEAGTSKNIYLFTDGWETEGQLENVLPTMVTANLKVFPVLPPRPPPIPNTAVIKLVAPTHGNSGESVNLKVVLENQNNRDVEGTLTLTRNGQPWKTDAITLKPGSQLFTYETELPETPLTSYGAAFKPGRAELDNYAPDNQAVTWISVQSKAKVLLLNGRPGGGRYLEEIFKREGFEVQSRPPENAPPPSGYGVVVFNNVEREKFSPAYLAAVERYVSEGGSFLMLGADPSFAPNSYRRTPIENVLPVDPKEPPREEKNRAVVLVIDKSGSMREENKMLYAQEAAKSVARQLKDNDMLAVIGFDISPFVVVPMESVGRVRATIESQISRLKPGGQTYFYPALLEAKRQIDRVKAARKHVVLISDGETRGTQGELIDLVNVMRNEMKVTVSAVAIGPDADIRIMKRISQYGGGLFHHTIDPSTLPQIVLQQLQEPRDQPQRETEFVPVQERRSEVLAGFSVRSYPVIRGYMETELKRGAHLDLAVPRENRTAPLMASWRFGRGKALAFTTDMEGRWTRNWIQWQELQKFWEKTLGWLHPEQEAIPAHEARVGFSGHQAVLDFFVYDEASMNSRFLFSVTGEKGGKTAGVLKQLADGHFQTVLPLVAPGNYRIEITEERKNRRIQYPPVGYTSTSPADNEISRPEFNTDLLSKLARETGGEINPKSVENAASQTFTTTYKPVRQPLIIAAFLLFLFEIALRKLVFTEPE